MKTIRCMECGLSNKMAKLVPSIYMGKFVCEEDKKTEKKIMEKQQEQNTAPAKYFTFNDYDLTE